MLILNVVWLFAIGIFLVGGSVEWVVVPVGLLVFVETIVLVVGTQPNEIPAFAQKRNQERTKDDLLREEDEIDKIVIGIKRRGGDVPHRDVLRKDLRRQKAKASQSLVTRR